MSEELRSAVRAVGGARFAWLLGEEPRSMTTKKGERRTVLTLHDPKRLTQTLAIWLDGEADDLPVVKPRSPVVIHVESVRSGQARGELVASVSREAVVAALTRAAGAQA